jgi:L-ribulokinase
MNSKTAYVIGVDYGTDSVRSVIVDAGNGDESSLLFITIPVGKMACFVMHSVTSFASTRWIM